MLKPVFCGLAALAALSACAPPMDAVARAETCRDAFRQYDRALAFDRDILGIVQPRPGIIDDRQMATSRIQQFGCVTFPREVPDPATLDLAPFAARQADNAAPREYLHLGILASNGTEARLRRLFQALGYPVRVKGAERLGRRFFLGPLSNEPDKANALAAARALGFESAYFLGRVP